MSRESCITHAPGVKVAYVRSDYRELMCGDAVAAALLSLFEYWANGAIALNGKLAESDAVHVGNHSIVEFETLLVGISSDKQIRQRLKKLAAHGYIQIKGKAVDGRPKSYSFMVGAVRKGLENLGQMTNLPRSNDQPTSVKQPTLPRSNDRSTILSNLDQYSLSVSEQKAERETDSPLSKTETDLAQIKASEPVTPELPTRTVDRKESSAASNSETETKNYAAANFSQKEYLSDPTGDRFRNELPPWRTGRGPNDWNEAILTEYVKWADEAFKKKHSRYTAVAFFSNCEMTARRGEMQGTSKAVALCEELQQRIRDRNHKAAQIEAAIDPSAKVFVAPVDDFDWEASREAKQRVHLMVMGRRSA